MELAFEGGNLFGAILQTVIEVEGAQKAAFELIAGKLCATQEEKNVLLAEYELLRLQYSNEIASKAFEERGSIDIEVEPGQ